MVSSFADVSSDGGEILSMQSSVWQARYVSVMFSSCAVVSSNGGESLSVQGSVQ